MTAKRRSFLSGARHAEYFAVVFRDWARHQAAGAPMDNFEPWAVLVHGLRDYLVAADVRDAATFSGNEIRSMMMVGRPVDYPKAPDVVDALSALGFLLINDTPAAWTDEKCDNLLGLLIAFHESAVRQIRPKRKGDVGLVTRYLRDERRPGETARELWDRLAANEGFDRAPVYIDDDVMRVDGADESITFEAFEKRLVGSRKSQAKRQRN